MVIEDLKNNRIIAPDGRILTNGKDYAIVHYLADGDSVNNWWDIAEEEYAERSDTDESLSADS